MSKSYVVSLAAILFLASIAIANFAGVSMSMIIHFLCPVSLVIIMTVGAFLYFYGEEFSIQGVVGILSVGFGFLWFMSRELWESWARGGDLAWQNFAGLRPLKAVLPEPLAVHPFVFDQSYILLWYGLGVGLIMYGGYLLYRGYHPMIQVSKLPQPSNRISQRTKRRSI